MKKIGIATITNYREPVHDFNYGNILQNYALQKFIGVNGMDATTIYYSSDIPEISKNIHYNSTYKSVSQFFDDGLRIIGRKIHKKELDTKKQIRFEKFELFINKHIKQTIVSYNRKSDFSKLSKEFDYYITGSDQVWNPYWEGSNEFYYLGFAPKGKRIAYAPSIGVDHIPAEMENNISSWIKNIDYYSVREEKGREIIRNTFQINAKLVCDPVFLLNKHQWIELVEQNFSNDYFVVYILGKKTVETKKQIKEFEKVTKKKAIDVFSRDNINSTFADPVEFVGLISNSNFVFTDSFHGAAFSVIFDKPIVLVDRNSSNPKSSYNMGSRLDNLLSLLNLKNRSSKYIIRNINKLPCKYDCTKINKLITESKKFLLSALGEYNEIK